MNACIVILNYNAITYAAHWGARAATVGDGNVTKDAIGSVARARGIMLQGIPEENITFPVVAGQKCVNIIYTSPDLISALGSWIADISLQVTACKATI